MSAHTPGPWSIGGKYAHKTVLLNANGESIASGGNNRSVQGAELEASLRLASAAPELLEALTALLPYAKYSRDASDAVAGAYHKAEQRAKAAIAKAVGDAAGELL